MTEQSGTTRGSMAIVEMKEFAAFAAGTQRYIRRSLDVALGGEEAIERWSRDSVENVNIRVQHRIYSRIADIRDKVPTHNGLDTVEPFMAPLLAVTAFDLAQNRLPSFSAYRFLYERLIGAGSRPWLPGAFCAAAALPHIEPAKRRNLLQSISENAATAPAWSNAEPAFYPAWVDKDDPEAEPPLLN